MPSPGGDPGTQSSQSPQRFDDGAYETFLQLGDRVANSQHAGSNHPGIYAPQVQVLPLGRVDELHRVEAESFDELPAAGVRLGRDLDDSRSDRELRAYRHIGRAEVEVDEQLIARKVPAAPVLRHERDNARVHQV